MFALKEDKPEVIKNLYLQCFRLLPDKFTPVFLLLTDSFDKLFIRDFLASRSTKNIELSPDLNSLQQNDRCDNLLINTLPYSRCGLFAHKAIKIGPLP